MLGTIDLREGIESGIVRRMTSSPHALAIEVATRRLLRVALLFGLTGSLVALGTTLQQGIRLTTTVLALAWSIAWASASARPQLAIPVLRRWRWTTVLVAGFSTATIVASGGFDSLLKTEANWLAWAAPVLLGTAASLSVAAILSSGLLAAFLLDGMSLQTILTGPDRYTAVTDILNPVIIALAALAVTGVFRLVLTNAVVKLWRARRGDSASSPAMRALLGGQPVLALPTGELEPSASTLWERLTPSQRDIIEQLARGLTPQQIALQRGIQVETVYEQLGAARRRTGTRTNEHLVVVAWPLPT